MSDTEAAAAEAPAPSPEVRMPRVRGETLVKLPDDLYIPPDALEVFLEAFEGPLDLLLYLIRKQNLDILDIPVLKITQQYMDYIALMRELRLELAAEYLVMAAWLAEIKSRILLPRPPAMEEEQGDPRMELVRRLQQYERFKTAAENLDAMPRVAREIFIAQARPDKVQSEAPLPVPGLRELMLAFREVLLRAELFQTHTVTQEPLSVRERMSRILDRLQAGGPARFEELVDLDEGRAGVVVCFLAVLELAKSGLLDIAQGGPFAAITVENARPREVAIEEQ
ncbi:MAG: segregation/condensation protein A [Nevskia sp.]|nr:segregation/condensation protein A [Nevskia sp.]